MQLLYPSFYKEESNYEYKPDDEVFVLFIKNNMLRDEISSREAFKTEHDARKHHWVARPHKDDIVRIEFMLVGDFLKQYDRKGMNPFESLNIAQFFDTYNKKYGTNF